MMYQFVAGAVVGGMLTLAVAAWDRRILRDRIDLSDARHDAYRHADTRADLDQGMALTVGVCPICRPQTQGVG